MKKKEAVTPVVKPTVEESLKAKLVGAMQKVLKDNQEVLTPKVQKVVSKSAKKISKKTVRKKAKSDGSV